MDGDLLPGGKVVLSGEGKWNLGDMCVEWDDQVLKNNFKDFFSKEGSFCKSCFTNSPFDFKLSSS